MKSIPKVPWDLAVFLTVTTVGFAYSVERLVHRDARPSFSIGTPSEAERVERGTASGRLSVDLGCLEHRLSGKAIPAEAASIRLRGKFCELTRREMRAFQGVRVKNLTNGFEGTIFLHGMDTTFVTDLVALQPGKNVIQLEWRAHQTAKPTTFTTEVVQQ